MFKRESVQMKRKENAEEISQRTDVSKVILSEIKRIWQDENNN